MTPQLSLIIAYTDSIDENRLYGLTKLMQSIELQTFRDFETIVVEDTQGRGMSAFPFKDKVSRIIPISDPEYRKFNKSWVMNVGARNAKTDNLIFIDAEISFDNPFLLEEYLHLTEVYKFFNGWSKYICLEGRDNPTQRIHSFGKTVHAMIGIFYSNKDFYFNKLGGYNENYFGYGGEDNDVFYRVEYLLKKIPVSHQTVYHNYHHWHPLKGANPLNPEREVILNKTIANPQDIINKLINTQIGNKKCPTLIQM